MAAHVHHAGANGICSCGLVSVGDDWMDPAHLPIPWDVPVNLDYATPPDDTDPVDVVIVDTGTPPVDPAPVVIYQSSEG
ncbi:MAG: hypothetical protein J0I33_07840 [Microbacterium ginsengisoli]|jgi:hypothetical protein|uniref:hypothetical protein n=1 Tax=Microbacterium TaxID=33882 RepID=UPI0006FFAA30|nr:MULTISPECIES: hypothetical protein [unclassified Microbacterium]KQR97708.1 hypothetical protein ASF93_13345 [Microbacterium sp. Leaf347]KQS01732.1 hypothetical protein ASG00_09870 [Microbacterium sp. Leaf351]MBN9198535.1 hypothetical protein [Microbacterium ginsengisoli]OJU78081.1 MAG: hypothetical protein BGO15_02455 [Microbacterium sp. 71-23]